MVFISGLEFPLKDSIIKFFSDSTLSFVEYSSNEIETFTKKGIEIFKSFLLTLLLSLAFIEQLDETSISFLYLFFPLIRTDLKLSSKLLPYPFLNPFFFENVQLL